MANAIDFVTVGQAKAWIPGFSSNPAPDETIQMLVTGVSREIVRITGSGIDGNPESPTYGASSLNSQINFTEILSGNGSNVLFLNNRPLRTINSLLVNGYAPPINVGYGVAGVAKHTSYSVCFQVGFGSGSAVTTVGWPTYGPAGLFPMGTNNVQIGYLAGYGQPVPDSSPVEYTAPEDLQEACLEIIAVNYTRRDRIGLDSENVQGNAATTYSKYEIPPHAALVIRTYTRVAMGAQQ
jgi:hypothetical protein